MNGFSRAQKCGAFLLIFLLLAAYLQPYYYPMDEAFQNLNKILQKPSALYWLGTDHLGRDMLARLASAVRLSFSLIVLSVGCALLFGLLFGVLAGAFGGWIDRIFSFVCHIIMALPGLLFVLLFAALSPGAFWTLYLGISLVMWVEFFRVVRAMTQTLAGSNEIQSSRLMGMSFFYCFKRHFFPRLAPVILTLSAFAAANAVLALATLGFINVGLRPPTPELGLMMTELFPYYYEAPYIFMLPIIVVCLLVFSFQLMSGRMK
ncbi:ABC transporter permease [Caviibacterium pharyngocola]|uniref:ABC transporter permease n=1 Tax=Caviibacterium pharyngocola TaxID=28159 RepID=A0A2M8RXW0_9PAST|nr:ABC transporter permease [Caviibacterium pharyngocola]